MTRETPIEQLLTIQQAAKRLNVGHRSLKTMGIPYIKFGKFVRYDPADIKRWIAENRIDPDDVRGTAPTWPERQRRRRAKKADEPLTHIGKIIARQLKRKEEWEKEKRRKRLQPE